MINNCTTFTKEGFEEGVAEKLLSIFEAGLSDAEIRNESYKAIKDISEFMKISGPAKIEQALLIVKNTMSFFDEAQQLDDNEIRAAISEWKHTPDPENNTADHLTKDNERFNDDPFESNYGAALNAKLRAKQQANKIGVRSILYNEDGVINSTCDLNTSIRLRQEELLLNVINYLKTRISPENLAKYPEIFSEGRMYNGDLYTGIIERIKDLYSSILGKENFNTRMLNKYYNDENFSILDAYSSWIILNNFDTIMLNTFGKAISINPDMAKFTGRNKYSIAGGSNVYTTWRTNEEIDLSKEINNISQTIITSLPFIPKKGSSSNGTNVKFNEFLYIISKIKDIPYKAESDWIIDFNALNESLPKEFKDSVKGLSFLGLINSLRDNPLEILPILFRLLNDDNVVESLVANKVIEPNTFLDIDLDLINSLYNGLFDLENENSLYSIQDKSGFENNNYFAFIALTIDSTYKSSFLQYFRDPQGNIYVRNMYDLSINNIEFAIRDAVNAINSLALIQDYDAFKNKYQITQSNRTFSVDGDYKLYYNGNDYTLSLKNGMITAVNSKTGYPITDLNLLNTLIAEYLKIPESISFIIKDFHEGPLKVTVSLIKDNISYEVNGRQFGAFTSKKDLDSLSGIILEVLKLNLNLDNKYLEAYRNKFGLSPSGTMATHLMALTSRVIANLYLSSQFKDLTPVEVKNKLNSIFEKGSTIKPVFDKKLGEIKLLTAADTKYTTELAEAKAQATGRLTSSLILDSNGNAVASSCLSRLLSSLSYQVLQQVKIDGAAALGFSLWNTGVFKGILQMKEIQDNTTDTSKSSTEFSAAEMEYGTVFIDFLLSLIGSNSATKRPLLDGVTAFIPSENSDKTYIGRMLIDLSKLKIGEESIFDIIRTDPSRIGEIIPYFANELRDFYNKALNNINLEWNKIGLLINSNVSYGHWESINMLAIAARKTPLQYVNDLITEYNNQNPNDPIVLIDLVHYVADKKGNLTTNLSFLENVDRFNNPTKLSNFLYEQNIETVKQLVKDKLDVEANEDFKKLKGAENWIDKRTGKIIFAKVWDYNPETGEEEVIETIRRPKDLSILDVIDPRVTGVEINPLIHSYNTLNYFLTLEFMGSTVGMFYAHPSKDTSSPLMDEKSRKAALDKRNVSFTASMHAFMKNLIQGIPEEINIAIMSDPKDIFKTISGDLFDDIKPYDGATFENPWFGEWENNSLGGAKVGLNKKTFTHYYDSKTGTGGIIKTANFCITNDRVRNSKFYLRMIRNMTDRKWRNLDGTDFITDITHDYSGNQINFANPKDKDGLLYFRKIEKNKEGKDEVRYYRINSIENIGENLYKRHLQEVDELGRIISEDFIEKDSEGNEISYLVNTNYSLWNLFGGAYSMEFLEGGSKLEFSENSIKLVANIANKVGKKPNNTVIVRTLEDIYQPLKHSDIHWMPTVGAVKLGAGNINGIEAYNISDPNKINFMKIKMNLSGIQLDKEHNADDEDLSIMTLVLSACAARGYTLELSQEMYNALASLARAGIKDYLDAFDEFFQNPLGVSEVSKDKLGNPISTNQRYLQVILDTLIDALAHSTNNDATILMVTLELLNKAKEGKEIAFKDLDTVPYSDPSVFRKLHSTISVALTRGAIKIKVSGVLSVLNPSHGIVKMYGDRMLSSYASDADIQAQLDIHDALPESELINDPGRIRIGRTYKLKHSDGTIELRNVKTLTDYWKLKQELSLYTSIKELFAPIPEMNFEGGRELAAYNATFKASQTAVPLQMEDPSEIKLQINSIRGWDKKLQKAKLLGLNIDDNIEPNSIEEYIALNFPVLSRESVLREVGLTSQDLSNFKKLVRQEKNGGVDLIKAAHGIWEDLPENWKNTYDDLDIRNILIEIISGAENDNDILKSIYKKKIDTAIEEYEHDYDSYLLYVEETTLDRTYNINDLASVHRLSDLKEAKASPEEIDLALKDVLRDLNILSGLKNPPIKKLMNLNPPIKKLMDLNSGNTQLYGVQIDSNLIKNYRNWLQANPNGIVAYRVNRSTFNTPESVNLGIIGNPFDWQKYGTGQCLKMFYDWLVTGNNYGEELATSEFRLAIINKILSSNSENTPILYYKELGRPSHATVIGYLINNKDLLKGSVDKKATAEEYVMQSGGAPGSDSVWADIAVEFGVTKLNHWRHGQASATNAPRSNIEISEEDYNEGKSKVAKAAKMNWGYQYATMKDDRLVRNWPQVKYADAIFAIGHIVGKGERVFPNKRNDTRLAATTVVQGGTGYAVGMAILEGKPVYVFDQERNMWAANINGKWKWLDEAPTLTKRFAGIGTREINEAGKQAIRDVFKKTFGLQNQGTLSTTPTNSTDNKDLNPISENDRSVRLDDGRIIEIDPNSVEIEPYEVVMPKVYATIFGLETSDDLNTIKKDREFFTKRLIERIKPKGISSSAYTIGLMRMSGKHTYILDRKQGIPLSLNFVQKEILLFRDKGKIWRVRNGEKMYEMLEGDTIWEYQSPDGTMLEVIVTDNIGHYILKSKFTTVNISSKSNIPNVINTLGLNRKNIAVDKYFKALDRERTEYGTDNVETQVLNILNIGGIEDLNDSPFGKYFLNLGHSLHTSFLKSLEIVAARIPALSMLSFMPMKVVAFEAPDINTAYVSTALILFQGSDYDIDAVSLASYSFDKSGNYVGHSPYFNYDTLENLEASLNIPFPTGKQLEIKKGYDFDYGNIISSDPRNPFILGGLTLHNPEAIRRFGKFIELCNKLGFVPKSNKPEYDKTVEYIKDIVNNHNDYINSDDAEDFSKNYVVSSMYKIGLSPANLVESQLAMDSITGPLKKVANSTIKALETSLDNPASFVTNIHGILLNMAGKKGVGICAVGLKSFFALTARYNEVLAHGTLHEQKRLKSDVVIAGKHYQMLANAYGTNIANEAIAQIISNLSNQDLALILSGLLSLATDNAKELALDKLNAANMLGMYIYGITIGMDFLTLADIICSDVGLVINEMMGSNSFTLQKGMSIQNIFDYLETAPILKSKLPLGTKLSGIGLNLMDKISLLSLYNLVHKSGLSLEKLLQFIEDLKNEVDSETSLPEVEKQAIHRAIEEAEDFIERVNIIENNKQIYNDFKKLNEGGDELRKQGLLLHINQGLETSYIKSINYIDTLTSVIADRKYSEYRQLKRNLEIEILEGRKSTDERKKLKSPGDEWKFDFHNFVFNEDYRNAWIDIYDGIIDLEKFNNSETYRQVFEELYPDILKIENINTKYNSVIAKIEQSKVFFNILDTMLVPHFLAYLQSADMLHQAMLKTSAKYRSVFDLGRRAINELGAFSTDDKEGIYRRTEQFIDRVMRDRYFLSKGIKITIPKGQSYFLSNLDEKVKRHSEDYSITDGLTKTDSKNSDTTIELGTRAGNASFKLLMETKIIPDLQEGRYGEGNNRNPALANNEFIKSLAPVLYKLTPLHNTVINYAPNINMSPRSDADKALFEKIKFEFNEFKSGHLGSIKYKLGDKLYDIIELFYYYNQIAFGGKPGENTLTSIFQDVLDYKPIKEFRDYENLFDKEGVLKVDTNSIMKEVAPRANPWTSNLKHIYYEDPNTGKLSYWTKVYKKLLYNLFDYDTGENFNTYSINNYVPETLGFANNEDMKNFVLNSINSDTGSEEQELSDKSKAIISFDLGRISQIKVRPWNGTQVDALGEYVLNIPKEYLKYFDNPPTTYIIDLNGNRVLGYDLGTIARYVEYLINCG